LYKSIRSLRHSELYRLILGVVIITLGSALPIQAASPEEVSLDDIVVIPTLAVLFTQSDVKIANATDIQEFHKEVAAIKEFFVQEAGPHLELELDYLQIDRRLALSEFNSPSSNAYHLLAANAAPFLRQSGIDLKKYPIVIAFWAWEGRNVFGAGKAYGGAAEGPGLGVIGGGAYNSQGVFDGPHAAISRVGIHETLHNMDGLFHQSGIERFWHADHMAGLMPLLLSEMPGAFLPRHTDEEMLIFAERESRREYSFPWQDQMVFYRRMVNRMTPAEWRMLEWGYRKEQRKVDRLTKDVYLEPLYQNMWVPEGDFVYVPMILRDRAQKPIKSAAVSIEGEQTLEYQSYAHTDGAIVLYENGLYGGWLPPGKQGELQVTAQLADAQSLSSVVNVHRQKRTMIVAPVRWEWHVDLESVCRIPVQVVAEHLPLGFDGDATDIAVEQPQLFALLGRDQLEVEQISPTEFVVLVPTDAVAEQKTVEIMLVAESLQGYDQRPLVVDTEVSWILRTRSIHTEKDTPTEIPVLVITRDRLVEGDFLVWAETPEGELIFNKETDVRYVATWTPREAGTFTIKIHSQRKGTSCVLAEEITVEVKQ
jgi:hypothetical protein